MTEQEQLIKKFKDECEEIIAKHNAEKTEGTGFAIGAEKEITELANETVSRHSNMPNIDVDQLKESLFSIAENYFTS